MSLFLTDEQIAEEIGIGKDKWSATVKVLEREGFPARDPRFCNRRYWPACKAWLDQDYGLATHSNGGPMSNDARSRAQERFS